MKKLMDKGGRRTESGRGGSRLPKLEMMDWTSHAMAMAAEKHLKGRSRANTSDDDMVASVMLAKCRSADEGYQEMLTDLVKQFCGGSPGEFYVLLESGQRERALRVSKAIMEQCWRTYASFPEASAEQQLVFVHGIGKATLTYSTVLERTGKAEEAFSVMRKLLDAGQGNSLMSSVFGGVFKLFTSRRGAPCLPGAPQLFTYDILGYLEGGFCLQAVEVMSKNLHQISRILDHAWLPFEAAFFAGNLSAMDDAVDALFRKRTAHERTLSLGQRLTPGAIGRYKALADLYAGFPEATIAIHRDRGVKDVYPELPRYHYLQAMVDACPDQFQEEIKEELAQFWYPTELAVQSFAARMDALSVVGHPMDATGLSVRSFDLVKQRHQPYHYLYRVVEIASVRGVLRMTVLKEFAENTPPEQEWRLDVLDSSMLTLNAQAAWMLGDTAASLRMARQAHAAFRKAYQPRLAQERERAGCLDWAQAMAVMAGCYWKQGRRFLAVLWKKASERMLGQMYGRLLDERHKDWLTISKRWGICV
mmetsp:Transcript_3609/g.12742  ORF Transcript_3609/g.12742 Transcript_3609/m.12742 type:complete len:533 (+) Transcript_3609:43-1641(+)